MNNEIAKKAIESLQNMYVLEEKKLKLLKQLEISLKGQMLGIDTSKGRYSLLPDHNKGNHRVNTDIVVGLINLDTQEKLYFDEPVFNVKTISIYNPKPKMNGLNTNLMTVAEKYLFNKYKESKKSENG